MEFYLKNFNESDLNHVLNKLKENKINFTMTRSNRFTTISFRTVNGWNDLDFHDNGKLLGIYK